MSHKNIETKRQYHRAYMSNYNKTHRLTDEQKAKKALYMRDWNAKNKDRVKVLSHKSYLKNKAKRQTRAKEYRKDNQEKLKVAKHNYYISKKDYFSKKSKDYYLANKDTIRIYKRKYAKTIISRFNSYKNSAKLRELSFSLDRKLFNQIMVSLCHYCGKENAFGIDRIDSNIGYEIENCLPCCKVCNYMKRDLTYKDFLLKIKEIYKNRNL